MTQTKEKIQTAEKRIEELKLLIEAWKKNDTQRPSRTKERLDY